jgi:S1-C subfamily serine protease
MEDSSGALKQVEELKSDNRKDGNLVAIEKEKEKEEPKKPNPPPNHGEILARVAEKCRPSVALIQANGLVNINGKQVPGFGWGSGFPVGPDLIVTNAHVINGFRVDALRAT